MSVRRQNIVADMDPDELKRGEGMFVWHTRMSSAVIPKAPTRHLAVLRKGC